ncbi:MAG: hypothetical protein PVH61_37195 [Candidatus Aminicenantes bacterium]|jgi:hypothetical protein
MKVSNKAFKTAVIILVIVVFITNICCVQQNRMAERKAATPVYFRVRSAPNRKKEESIQSLHRLLRMLQNSMGSVQVRVDKANKENKSGFHYEMPKMELPVSLGEFSKL